MNRILNWIRTGFRALIAWRIWSYITFRTIGVLLVILCMAGAGYLVLTMGKKQPQVKASKETIAATSAVKKNPEATIVKIMVKEKVYNGSIIPSKINLDEGCSLISVLDNSIIKIREPNGSTRSSSPFEFLDFYFEKKGVYATQMADLTAVITEKDEVLHISFKKGLENEIIYSMKEGKNEDKPSVIQIGIQVSPEPLEAGRTPVFSKEKIAYSPSNIDFIERTIERYSDAVNTSLDLKKFIKTSNNQHVPSAEEEASIISPRVDKAVSAVADLERSTKDSFFDWIERMYDEASGVYKRKTEKVYTTDELPFIKAVPEQSSQVHPENQPESDYISESGDVVWPRTLTVRP